LEGDYQVAGGYAQSKLAAEWLVQQSGVPASIFRLGLLTGSSQSGVLPKNDLLSMVIRRLAKGIFEELDWKLEVDMTPVDAAAEAIVREKRRGVHHIVARQGVRLGELVEAIREVVPDVPVVAGPVGGVEAGFEPLALFQRTGWDFSGALERPDAELLVWYVRSALGQ
jgi:nucleoside-diphosphate-sugar epimerase